MNPAMSKRIRSLRSRTGRAGSGLKSDQEDSIPLDLARDPNQILKEILLNICSTKPVSTSRKLGHLNNFVKLLCNLSDTSLISVPMEVILTCLKGALVSDVKEVRAAAVRVLRYLINDDNTNQLFINLHLDFLVTRCLDISHFNEVERIQAVRLVRKIAHIKRKRTDNDNKPIVPLSLMACIVSISLDGAEERDRVHRTCLAVLCELALLQPWLVVKCNGILALVNAILECHLYQRINESLCLSFMHIVNHPGLRKWHHPVLDVSPTFAPYTELNYRLHPDVDESKINEELEMRFMASKMAIVSLLRTWTGLFHICHSQNMIMSLIDALAVPNEVVRRGILSVLADLFYFNELLWTKDFPQALKAAAPGHFRDSWRISEGFVVAEGKSLLPVRRVSRPDLVDCHLALVLSSFLRAGLLKALTSVAISNDSCSSVSAVIILGSVLHLASRILPAEYETESWQSDLPRLFKSDSCHVSIEESLRVNMTVKRLQEVYAMRNNPPKPYSVYLRQLLSKKSNDFRKRNLSLSSSPRSRSTTLSESEASTSTFSLRRNRSLNLMRDFSDNLSLTALKNTKVLAAKDHTEWDWNALQSLFLSQQSTSFLKLVGVDDQVRRFYRRLVYFYQPSSCLFSNLELAKDGNPDPNRIYIETAILMMKHLAYADDEGQRMLKNLVTNIVQSLPKVNSEATNYSKATGSLSVTCSREYFLILSALSRYAKGDNLLKQYKAYQYFLCLASKETHETLIRLLVSSLHYSEDGPARMVLSRILTTCSESARLYATGFLRVLLRATYAGFQTWGIELLTTQLYDESNDVALEALDILHEACDDVTYLRAVVRLRPTLLHLGERGAILVCRFMSVPQGFAYLSHNNYLIRELQRWWNEYNERYVTLVEELLKLSFTSYERANKDDGFVRRSGNKKSRQSVYLPAHLYGELCRHEEGAALLEKENIAFLITQSLRKNIDEDENERKTLRKDVFKNDEKNSSSLLKMKSYLWALAHIGSTVYGLPLLHGCQSLQLITSLAFSSRSASIRGTCFYCLSTVAQTIPGVEALKKLGYQCVLKTVVKNDVSDDVNEYVFQPIITPRRILNDAQGKSVSISSQWSTASGSSNTQKKLSVGSLSNTSLNTDVTISTIGESKSARSSKRSSLRGKKNHKRSSSEARPPPSSPTFNGNSFLSVFDNDSVTSEQRSPARFSSVSTSERKRSLPAIGSIPNRSKTMSITQPSNNQGNKLKWKERFMQIFQSRYRSKSASFGTQLSTNSSQTRDDVSSGYASDHAHLESIIEHQRKKEEPEPSVAIQLPTRINVIQTSHIRTTSNHSVKSSKEVSPKSENRTSTPQANSAASKHDFSRWNTNNSGQFKTDLLDVDTSLVPSPSHYTASMPQVTPVHNSIGIASKESSLRRSISLPNIIDKSRRETVSSIQQSVSISSNQIDNFRFTSTENEIKTSLISGAGNAPNHDDVISIEITPPIKSRMFELNPVRDRGNTQTSHDSGVITDTLPTSSLSHENSPLTRTNDVASDQSFQALSGLDLLHESCDEEQWRFTKPEGLPALRLIRKEQERRVWESRKSTLKRSFLRSDILSYEERDHIIRSTHYVGIVIPTSPSNFFMASVGQIPISALFNQSMKDSHNKDKHLEEAELMRERKVSIMRHAPKLRGLDETTFGPAVTAGLSYSNRGRIHSEIVTPCGRTPDSILTEASDMCYIGGQLVKPGSEEHVALLHKEILLLVTNLASSVGVKGHETSLLMMKEKKPEVFDSIALYNNIIHIMSDHSFRLASRRFVQELFQDVKFTEVHQEAQKALKTVID